jgi:hypothetical protein
MPNVQENQESLGQKKYKKFNIKIPKYFTIGLKIGVFLVIMGRQRPVSRKKLF